MTAYIYSTINYRIKGLGQYFLGITSFNCSNYSLYRIVQWLIISLIQVKSIVN